MFFGLFIYFFINFGFYKFKALQKWNSWNKTVFKIQILVMVLPKASNGWGAEELHGIQNFCFQDFDRFGQFFSIIFKGLGIGTHLFVST